MFDVYLVNHGVLVVGLKFVLWRTATFVARMSSIRLSDGMRVTAIYGNLSNSVLFFAYLHRTAFAIAASRFSKLFQTKSVFSCTGICALWFAFLTDVFDAI